MKKVKQEPFCRKIISFYRYAPIENLEQFRNDLYRAWSPLEILGRIYVAEEGINAQMSVPEAHWESFLKTLSEFPFFKNIFINHTTSESSYAFFKLDLRIKKNIVVHKLKKNPLETTKPGKHLSPREFHQMLEDKDTVVVDARNRYECDIGHFENALLPLSKTFSGVLPELKEKLEPFKAKKILMYCTGGIRCEVASSFLKEDGFENVYQLQGGIVHYLNEIQKAGLDSKYKGSVYVFDERMAESTNQEKLGKCYQCGTSHSIHTNCGYIHCHDLMIQCSSCSEKYQGCCSVECIEKRNLL